MRSSLPLLALGLVGSTASAQNLLTTDDGVSLRGTVRLLQGNAATCNVIAENEQGRYEEMRVNQDQPLHLWELEFSVFNGSGRALDHLIAYYNIASPWPPCTNWTENYQLEGDYVYEQVQWADPGGRIQHTGAATPTLPNQTHTETILLLAFNGVRPQFTDWSVNYTFMEGEAVAAVAEPTAGPAPSAPTLPSGPLCVDITDEACWMELDTLPGCYILNPDPQLLGEIDTWSGQCSGGYGTGTATYATEDYPFVELPYESGEIHGTTVVHEQNGAVTETSWVHGEAHGMMVMRNADGDVMVETPFVNGERHGTEIVRNADGEVREETPYVNGELHGTQIQRFANSVVVESPYVNGDLHGMRIERVTDGDWRRETPYVNGEIHGTMITRYFDGDVTETPWVNGEIHGTRIERNADGRVFETPYVNGTEGETRCVAGCN